LLDLFKEGMLAKPANKQLFGYVVGGHDTTSTTMAWWVKFIARSQESQNRLRETLHAAFPEAVFERRVPTVTEITKTPVPYLDAVMEETLRHSKTLPLTARQAVVDTNILGYSIPKGTNVIVASHGASFLFPAFEIDEEKRTEGARAAKDRYGDWNPEDIGEYIPERWLKLEKDNDGVERELYDPQAGPQMSFGAGPRSCFGRKLAYLEMRIAICFLIWRFEFLDSGEELNNMIPTDRFTTVPKDCYVKLRILEH
jgi:cytochrome P450